MLQARGHRGRNGLDSLATETAMGKVTIYRFQMYNSQTDEVVTSRRWGTEQAIKEIAGGHVLKHTATEVDDSVIRSDIHGFTARDFDPRSRARDGFQTEVKR
jgi:hypothetical protein